MNNTNAVTAPEEVPASPSDAAGNYVVQLREKILFGLSVYKFLSPSMLHVFLGTSTPSSLWKDEILAKLIEDGEVIREEIPLTSPFDRSQTYTILRLPSNIYTPPAALTPNPEPRATDLDESTATAA